MLQFVEQVPHKLMFGLLREETQLPITIYQQKTLHVGDFQFCFAIIGESHSVRIKRHDTFLQEEILACLNLTAGWHVHACHDLQNHQLRAENYHVQITFQRHLPYPPQTGETSLLLEFPTQHPHQTRPLTHIAWNVQHDAIQWQTIHSYPNVDTVVHTLSHFMLR